jgi:hypothetical protein
VKGMRVAGVKTRDALGKRISLKPVKLWVHKRRVGREHATVGIGIVFVHRYRCPRDPPRSI